jgi:hypothetical protein
MHDHQTVSQALTAQVTAAGLRLHRGTVTPRQVALAGAVAGRIRQGPWGRRRVLALTQYECRKLRGEAQAARHWLRWALGGSRPGWE